jgi:hypothetical protein
MMVEYVAWEEMYCHLYVSLEAYMVSFVLRYSLRAPPLGSDNEWYRRTEVVGSAVPTETYRFLDVGICRQHLSVPDILQGHMIKEAHSHRRTEDSTHRPAISNTMPLLPGRNEPEPHYLRSFRSRLYSEPPSVSL